MKTWPRLAVAALCIFVTGACGSEGDPNGAPTTSVPSVTNSEAAGASPSSTAARTAVDGTWGLTQNRADVVAHLEKAGFGDRAQEFLQVQKIWDVDQWQWTFASGEFKALWMTPDRVWTVADTGTYKAAPNELTLTFASGETTTFAYAVSDDTLRLDWTAHTGEATHQGFPDEAFWRTYLAKPLTRVS